MTTVTNPPTEELRYKKVSPEFAAGARAAMAKMREIVEQDLSTSAERRFMLEMIESAGAEVLPKPPSLPHAVGELLNFRDMDGNSIEERISMRSVVDITLVAGIFEALSEAYAAAKKDPE